MYAVFDLLNGARVTQNYVEESLSCGVKAIHITINNFRTIDPVPDLRYSLRELAAYRAHMKSVSEVTRVVETFDDFARAEREGKLAVVLGYQNVPGLERNLKMMEAFYDLGVRVIQIAHNVRNLYADGCAEPANAGLSALGRELIAILNELGMVIDLSHVGERSGIEAIELSRHPVAVTHANCLSICNNVRNKSDAMLESLAAKKGVLGITYLPPVVVLPERVATASDVLAHIKHAIGLMGVSGVGIGSDFITDQPEERYKVFMTRPDVYGTWPWRYPINSLQDQQDLLGSLKTLGLAEADIQAIAGDNFMRLFHEVFANRKSQRNPQ